MQLAVSALVGTSVCFSAASASTSKFSQCMSSSYGSNQILWMVYWVVLEIIWYPSKCGILSYDFHLSESPNKLYSQAWYMPLLSRGVVFLFFDQARHTWNIPRGKYRRKLIGWVRFFRNYIFSWRMRIRLSPRTFLVLQFSRLSYKEFWILTNVELFRRFRQTFHGFFYMDGFSKWFKIEDYNNIL